MADIDLKAATPDTTLPSTGFLFGADSQAASSPSVYSTQTVATALLGSTSLTGATITTSQPVVDMAQTWNAGAVTFTGLRFNATDTASASLSLLMDLQVGGSSRFNVNKNGVATLASSLAVVAGNITTSNGYSIQATGANANIWARDNTAFFAIGGSSDTILSRRNTANLRFGAADAAAPVAQTLSVQSVVAGTSNTAGANLTITGSQGTGTGAGGSIIFQVAPAGSSGTAQNALVTALTISTTTITAGFSLSVTGGISATVGNSFIFASRGRVTPAANGVFTLLNDGQTGFDRLQFGGTTSSFPALKRSTTILQARLADDSDFATVQGKLRADVNAVAETPTATHTITITDAAGTAYKVLCVAA